MCTELKQPLKKKGNFEFAVDKQAFVDQGWVIKFKDLKLGEAIGKGEFAGSVPLVKCCHTWCLTTFLKRLQMNSFY